MEQIAKSLGVWYRMELVSYLHLFMHKKKHRKKRALLKRKSFQHASWWVFVPWSVFDCNSHNLNESNFQENFCERRNMRRDKTYSILKYQRNEFMFHKLWKQKVVLFIYPCIFRRLFVLFQLSSLELEKFAFYCKWNICGTFSRFKIKFQWIQLLPSSGTLKLFPAFMHNAQTFTRSCELG